MVIPPLHCARSRRKRGHTTGAVADYFEDIHPNSIMNAACRAPARCGVLHRRQCRDLYRQGRGAGGRLAGRDRARRRLAGTARTLVSADDRARKLSRAVAIHLGPIAWCSATERRGACGPRFLSLPVIDAVRPHRRAQLCSEWCTCGIRTHGPQIGNLIRGSRQTC